MKLNEAQKEQLNAIYAETKPRTLEIMKQIENAHKELNKIRQEEEEKIRLILNEKQLQKFDKHRMRKAKQYRLEKPKVKEKRNMKTKEKNIKADIIFMHGLPAPAVMAVFFSE